MGEGSIKYEYTVIFKLIYKNIKEHLNIKNQFQEIKHIEENIQINQDIIKRYECPET